MGVIIVFLIFYLYMIGKGDIGSPLAYLITIFLIMFASDAMAFVISTAVPNPIVAMTVMPLLLLIQLVMAGVLFELGDMASFFANFTISKWGMASLGKIGDITSIPSRMRQKLDFTPPGGWISSSDAEMYDGGMIDVIGCWFLFTIFIAAFYFMSVGALKLTTKKVKK